MSAIARSSDRPSRNSPGSSASPPTTNARSMPASRSRPEQRRRGGRGRGSSGPTGAGRAEAGRLELARRARPSRPSPLAGDAVTDTGAPAGRNAAWARAFLSGTSSNFGSASERASASRPPLGPGRRRPARRHRHQTNASGIEAFFRMMYSSSASSIAWSIGGASYSASIRFQMAFARWAASSEPSSAPLLEAVVVGGLGAVEGGLEVGQGVGAAEVVGARLVGQDRVERLAVLGQVDALRTRLHHPALVGVEDELLVADRQPAFEPARGVEHEVDPGQHVGWSVAADS